MYCCILALLKTICICLGGLMQAILSLPDEFQDELQQQILAMARESFETVKRESSYPRFMRIEEASKFMNCSRSTLTTKFIPAGLKVVVIDSLQYIEQKDAIDFMEQHKN